MQLILLKKKKKQKNKKKGSLKKFNKKITDSLDPRKTKMVVEFHDRESASIKSFTVNKKNEKVTT